MLKFFFNVFDPKCDEIRIINPIFENFVTHE